MCVFVALWQLELFCQKSTYSTGLAAGHHVHTLPFRLLLHLPGSKISYFHFNAIFADRSLTPSSPRPHSLILTSKRKLHVSVHNKKQPYRIRNQLTKLIQESCYETYHHLSTKCLLGWQCPETLVPLSQCKQLLLEPRRRREAYSTLGKRVVTTRWISPFRKMPPYMRPWRNFRRMTLVPSWLWILKVRVGWNRMNHHESFRWNLTFTDMYLRESFDVMEDPHTVIRFAFLNFFNKSPAFNPCL